MFKRATLFSLGEYISVRDRTKLWKKIESGEDSEYNVTPRSVSAGKGYVITSPNWNKSKDDSKCIQDYPKGKAWINMNVWEGIWHSNLLWDW